MPGWELRTNPPPFEETFLDPADLSVPLSALLRTVGEYVRDKWQGVPELRRKGNWWAPQVAQFCRDVLADMNCTEVILTDEEWEEAKYERANYHRY